MRLLDAVASQDDDSISAQSNGTGLSNRSGVVFGSFNGEAQGVVFADGVDYAALLNSDSDDFTSITDNINTADILAGATANFNVIKATLSNANGTDSSSNTENSQQTSNFGSTRKICGYLP